MCRSIASATTPQAVRLTCRPHNHTVEKGEPHLTVLDGKLAEGAISPDNGVILFRVLGLVVLLTRSSRQPHDLVAPTLFLSLKRVVIEHKAVPRQFWAEQLVLASTLCTGHATSKKL